MFDIKISMKNAGSATFTNIHYSEYPPLLKFLLTKKVSIKNLAELPRVDARVDDGAGRGRAGDDAYMNRVEAEGDEDESEEDEDYKAPDAESDAEDAELEFDSDAEQPVANPEGGDADAESPVKKHKTNDAEDVEGDE